MWGAEPFRICEDISIVPSKSLVPAVHNKAARNETFCGQSLIDGDKERRRRSVMELVTNLTSTYGTLWLLITLNKWLHASRDLNINHRV
jgi:hypothetical protein